MDESLKNILYSDPVKNIAAIGFFSNYPIKEYYIEGNSAIILGKSDNLWIHIVSSSAKELSILLSKYSHITKYYFSAEDWMIPIILENEKSDWILTTNRYILNKEIHFTAKDIELSRIDISYAEYIYNNSNYKQYTPIEYIKDRLLRDISIGIWNSDKLIAWGFTHDDGALGFLHVLKNYRKKGYSKILLDHLIKSRQETKKPIFVNIVPDNVPAINLISKYGFKFDCKVSWVKLL